METVNFDVINENETDVKIKKLSKAYLVSKRIFDLISSSIALIVLSPIFLIIMVAIKIGSKGPAIFSHKRVGKNGKIIKVYKFRSMVNNAEEVIKNFTPEQKAEFEKNFKLEDDPRITKIGKFLRKTSLDELPQLLNIIIGDMSVVGPRPVVEDELERYGIYAKKFLSVTPGLTGNWQANGRSITTYEERVQLDMEYIDNASFWFDIKIILKTVLSVIKGQGAM